MADYTKMPQTRDAAARILRNVCFLKKARPLITGNDALLDALTELSRSTADLPHTLGREALWVCAAVHIAQRAWWRCCQLQYWPIPFKTALQCARDPCSSRGRTRPRRRCSPTATARTAGTSGGLCAVCCSRCRQTRTADRILLRNRCTS